MHHKYAITHEAKEYVQDIFQDDLLFVHVCVCMRVRVHLPVSVRVCVRACLCMSNQY